MKATSNSCFSSHNLFLKENGEFFAFGWNGYSQLGTGHSESSVEPFKIMNNENIKSISLGHCHSFYLERNGDLYGCGLNSNGQLGLGDIETRNRFVHITSNVKKISTTYKFTIIQKENKKLYFTGQGLGKCRRSFTYLDINNVSNFCCGFDHALFLTDNGELWVLGSNEYEELSAGIKEKYLRSPTLLMVDKNIFSICCGYENSVILTKNYRNKTEVKCFGKSINTSSLQTLSEDINIKSVHCGAYHTLLLTDNGDVYGCGGNQLGQLSLKTFLNTNNFKKLELSDIVQVTTGYSHSIFLNNKNEIFICGHQNRLGFFSDKPLPYVQKLDFTGLMLFNNSKLLDVWSPDIHSRFNVNFRISVFTFLNCMKKIFNHTKNFLVPLKLPKPLLFIIIKFSYEMDINYKIAPRNYLSIFNDATPQFLK